MEEMKFPRGDGTTHGISLLASKWSAGGRMFFAAKQQFDDDLTDSEALIKWDWGDEVVSDVIINGVAYKKYNCFFPPAATHTIQTNGAGTLSLLGEFQWVPQSGVPVTYPAIDEDKIPVTLYADINNRTAP